MIIFRYLAREVFLSSIAVSSILLVIIFSGRFIKYLADAAAGKMQATVIFSVMFYRLPDFLELILPLGLFLGILLSYGRLYMESEMTVMTACGMSQGQLAKMTLFPALSVSTFVALFSLWLGPMGAERVEQLFQEQDSLSEFDTLTPGRFKSIANDSRVTYAESLSADRKTMKNVFISDISRVADSTVDTDDQLIVLVAETGIQYFNQEEDTRYIRLENGYRYEGVPGQADYRVIAFESYVFRLEPSEAEKTIIKREAKSTVALMNSEDLADQAEFHWRLAIPVLVPIITLIAVAMSEVKPRQGRFLKLIPALFLYLVYLGLLIAGQSMIEKAKTPSQFGLWWVHGIFLMIVIWLYRAYLLTPFKPKRQRA